MHGPCMSPGVNEVWQPIPFNLNRICAHLTTKWSLSFFINFLSNVDSRDNHYFFLLADVTNYFLLAKCLFFRVITCVNHLSLFSAILYLCEAEKEMLLNFVFVRRMPFNRGDNYHHTSRGHTYNQREIFMWEI